MLYSHFQVLPFAHNLCLEFGSHHDSLHKNTCKKRHDFVKEDEPQSSIEFCFIKFRILHFYTPVHYKVKIFAHGEVDGEWKYPISQSKIIEIFHAKQLSHEWYSKGVFQRIFNRMNDAIDPYFEAKIFMKLTDIYFIEDIIRSDPVTASFNDELLPYFVDSRQIVDRLEEMVSEMTNEE